MSRTSAMHGCPTVRQILEDNVLHQGVAPDAVAAWGTFDSREGGVGTSGSAGSAYLDTLFDLASITKTVVATTVGLLVERGALSWDASIESSLTELRGTIGGKGTLAEHLSHRAGLKAHIELFLPQYQGYPVVRSHTYWRAACAPRDSLPPAEADTPPLYSDLGYILCGAAVERTLDRPLDDVIRSVLTNALGIEIDSVRGWASRDARFAERLCPTEPLFGLPLAPVGRVHDDNSWALSGFGTSGHAGLFGTVDGVMSLGRLLLLAHDGSGPLAKATSQLLKRRAGGTLRLGLDGISGPTSMAGTLAGPDTFGHLGFTGTSFWCDPSRRAVTVFLSNRVHPTRSNLKIKLARPRVHDELWMLADAATGA